MIQIVKTQLYKNEHNYKKDGINLTCLNIKMSVVIEITPFETKLDTILNFKTIR